MVAACFMFNVATSRSRFQILNTGTFVLNVSQWAEPAARLDPDWRTDIYILDWSVSWLHYGILRTIDDRSRPHFWPDRQLAYNIYSLDQAVVDAVDNVQYEDTMTSPVFTITSCPGLIVCTVVVVTSENEILSSCGLGTVGGLGSGREQICHSIHYILTTYQEVIV